MDSDVRKVMEVDSVTIIKVPIRLTFPTTQPKRKYMNTPRIVNNEGVNTPPNVPDLLLELSVTFLIMKQPYITK
ncbi:hypothetical protein D770_02085 [Flammeovirgaceae bacterium 311]|nr:hypothetical protein D770_02085 [Flammeovirgaceae bacterium 311]